MPDDRGNKPDVRTRLGTPIPIVKPAVRILTPPPLPTVLTEQPTFDVESTLDHEAPPLDPTVFPAGTRIKQYELIRELGRGGMGIVYAARDLKLGRRVAMKFLRAGTREVVDRFLIEARATAQCNHDNIVIIYEVDEYEGVPFMVLEYLEGQQLRDLMGGFSSGNKLPPSRVVELALPIARALERAHALGVAHRDLKPENVIVTSGGQVKVLDFGIAKAMRGENERPSRQDLSLAAQGAMTLTREGAFVGTLPYMSPEQAGVDDVDHRTDLWALGVIMFEMLTGKHPVQPLRNDVIIHNLLTPGEMPSVRELAPDAPDLLAEVIDHCLRKLKEERIASASAVIAALEELLPGRHGRTLRDGESPFPGLAAFQETDANRFYGRSREITRMVARVREQPLTAVIGASGSGKSSFIRAGVGPALKQSGDRWDIVTLRPGRQPMVTLASVVQRLSMLTSNNEPRSPTDHDWLIHRLEKEPGYLGVLLRERAHAINGQLLLFVDQFEELYTLVPDPATRRAFTAALSGVADDAGAPLRVVVSMRADFLDRVPEDKRFSEELTRGLFFLAQPDRDSLREALEQPIEMVGYRFETSAMTGEMIDALAGMPGALPLLQFAAAKLWDQRDRRQRLLTTASYHAIGGISGALATHADEVIASMNASAQRLAQRVFRKLVTPERTRAIVELSELTELGGGDEITRVIDQLVAARLLVVQTRADTGGSVELVHESLIERWPMLRRWLDEDQEDAAYLAQVSAAAKQWDQKGRAAGLLWRGATMTEAKRWYEQRPRTVGSREQAFLDAVFALERRKKRLRLASLVTIIAVLAIIAGGASIAYVSVRSAEARAQAQADRAQDALAKKLDEERRRSEAERARIEAERARTEAERARTEAELRAAGLEGDAARLEIERREAEAAKLSAEEEARRAEESKRLAEQEASARRKEVKLTAEELAVVNAELERKVLEAKTARDKATAAAAETKKLYAELQNVHGELQKALAVERARVKQLEEEKKKLTTTLKQ
ncbi:MAG: protein kinase [Myxococcota bacterium]|nr:protein kinase [Myxococcota bacterium]